MEASKGELVPGGLAMVVGSVNPIPVIRIGTVVTLKNPEIGPSGRPAWAVENYENVLCLSIHLMPIKPEADPLATEHEQCQHA